MPGSNRRSRKRSSKGSVADEENLSKVSKRAPNKKGSSSTEISSEVHPQDSNNVTTKSTPAVHTSLQPEQTAEIVAALTAELSNRAPLNTPEQYK